MKVKIGTVLDSELLRRTRLAATREGKRLSRVIEEALSEHLDRKDVTPGAQVAKRTYGCIRLPAAVVHRVLREEPGLLDEI